MLDIQKVDEITSLGYHRVAKIKIEIIIPLIVPGMTTQALKNSGIKRSDPMWKGNTHTIFCGKEVKMTSTRYRTFRNSGTVCVKCGIKGKFFGLERHINDKGSDTKYHLNLYAIDSKGNEVLMTKDHIIPKAKKGSDRLSNLQTMCTICNAKKADSLEAVFMKHRGSIK